MLRANVGLSRKVSRNYDSDGYSVNLDGEINAPPDDAEAVLERIRELFQLAEEALALEVDRDQGDRAIGRRDEDRSDPSPQSPPPRPDRGASSAPDTQDLATPKQVKYLHSLASKRGLSLEGLSALVSKLVGVSVPLSELTRRQVGVVIDHLARPVQNVGNAR